MKHLMLVSGIFLVSVVAFADQPSQFIKCETSDSSGVYANGVLVTNPLTLTTTASQLQAVGITFQQVSQNFIFSGVRPMMGRFTTDLVFTSSSGFKFEYRLVGRFGRIDITDPISGAVTTTWNSQSLINPTATTGTFAVAQQTAHGQNVASLSCYEISAPPTPED